MSPNTPKKLSLIKLFSLPKFTESGNSLVPALAIGTLASAAVVVGLVQAGKQKTNVVSNEQAQQAMAVAEAGIAQMQGMFVEEPRLAMAPNLSKWAEMVAEVENATEGQETTKYDATLNTVLVGNNSPNTSCPNASPLAYSTEDDDKPTAVVTEMKSEVFGDANANITASTKPDWVDMGNGNRYRVVNMTHSGGISNLSVQGQSGDAIAEINIQFDANATRATSVTDIEVNGTGVPGFMDSKFFR